MKISFFADSYKPYLSGVTNSVEILVKQLRLLGHQVLVFAPRYPNHIDLDQEIIRCPSLPTRYPKFRLALPIFRFLPKTDLIHTHSPFQMGLLAWRLARRRRIPLVYSFHTFFTRYLHFARFIPKLFAKVGIVAYLRWFCRKADAIICPSELAKRLLRAWEIKRPIYVIPSGIEIEQLPKSLPEVRARLRLKHQIPPEAKVLLYVGRLSKEKNLPFLLKAFEQLEASDVYLVLVGGGPLEQSLRRRHNPRIIVIGEISYPEILGYYAIGDIFLFSSLTETQGLVIAEAKAAGLPVVALFAGGLVGTIRSGVDGFLTKRTLGDFLLHVKTLLADHPLREKMSQAARQDALSRFSAGAVAKQIENVYNSLIKGGT